MDFRTNPADAAGLHLLIRKYRPSHHVRSVPDSEAAQALIRSLEGSGVTTAEVVAGPDGRLFVRWRA